MFAGRRGVGAKLAEALTSIPQGPVVHVRNAEGTANSPADSAPVGSNGGHQEKGNSCMDRYAETTPGPGPKATTRPCTPGSTTHSLTGTPHHFGTLFARTRGTGDASLPMTDLQTFPASPLVNHDSHGDHGTWDLDPRGCEIACSNTRALSETKR